MERFIRQSSAIGEENTRKLSNSKVLVFGIGGVGGHVIETLARCSVGYLTIVDKDVVSISNINRQIVADESTIGKSKAEVMKERISKINPACKVEALSEFYCEETSSKFDFFSFDYVVDAIDDVRAKVDIIEKCAKANVNIITSMGTANHLDPFAFKIDDVYKTDVCPLAKIIRKSLRDRGIEKGKVSALYSTETPLKPISGGLSSVAFCPSVAGILIASKVVKDLCST